MLCSQPVVESQSTPFPRGRLSDVYSERFRIIAADSPKLLEEAYRLRYQIYCHEHEYETPDDHPRHCETDEFDIRSVHSILVDRATEMVTGTVRLILPDPKAPGNSFPIQHICNHPLLSDLLLLATAAEVSRFAVSKRIRRLADGLAPAAVGKSDCAVDARQLQCSIVLGLMRATVQMSYQHGITDWFAVMEPALLRLLARFGIYFRPIGSLVQYHGVRQPCYANVDALVERVRQENFELWEFVTEPGDSVDLARVASNF